MKAYFTKKPMYTITHMQWLKITGIKKPNHVNMNSAVGEEYRIILSSKPQFLPTCFPTEILCTFLTSLFLSHLILFI